MIDIKNRRKILVLGGSSRIASMIRKSWSPKPMTDVIWQYREKSNQNRNNFLQNEIYFNLMSYPADLSKSTGNIHTVICLAGVSSGTKSELAMNRKLAEAGLNIAEHLGARQFFYASSIAVYGYGQSLMESDVPRPSSHYGQSKLDAENFLREANSFVSIVSMRMANFLFADSITRQLVSPPQNNLINLDFFPNGQSLCRSYIDPCSLTHIFDILVKTKISNYSVINIASAETIKVDSLLNKLSVPWIKNNCSNWDGQKITIDTSLLKEIVGNSNLKNLWNKSISEWKDIN